MQNSKSRITVSDRLRHATAPIMMRIGTWIYRLGVHPDTLTVIGFVFILVASWFIAQGGWRISAGLIIIGGMFDILDGATAKAMKKPNPFGALLDSTLDRYADGVIFGALSYHFAVQNQAGHLLLSLAALLGSFAVSYVRARADAPDIAQPTKAGLFTRFERVTIIIVALMFADQLLIPALWVLAIGTNLTALQRMFLIRNAINIGR